MKSSPKNISDLSPQERQEITALGYAAFEAVLEDASEAGLWDLHRALEKGRFRSTEGTTRLIRGGWGSLGNVDQSAGTGAVGFRSACVLNALFHREAERFHDKLRSTIFISNRAMMKQGFRIGHFCRAWDAGLLDQRELLSRLDRFITARMMKPA